jgi:hypothetical protein
MPKAIVVKTLTPRSFEFEDEGRKYVIKGESGKFLVERTDVETADKDKEFWGD